MIGASSIGGGPPCSSVLLWALALVALRATLGALKCFSGVPLWARFLPSSILTFHIYEQTRRLIVGRYLD